MIKFFHHLFNPHCPDCRAEKEDDKQCVSCETLQLEISRLRHDNERLLEAILHPNVPAEPKTETVEFKPITSGHVPWNVKRQTLEREERIRAAQLKENAPKPSINVEEEMNKLEKELDNVRQERETQTTSGNK